MSAATPHARLRAATAEAHAGLEDGLDWRARVATRAGYRALLADFHGFHAAYEPAIGAALADEAFFRPRRRLAALAADLGELGLSAAGIAGLRQPGPVRLAAPGEALGALYVLEGSTLGGRVIARHLAAIHGPGLPQAYYGGHGPRTGAMWAAFRGRLDGLTPAEEPAAIAAAVTAFETLHAWLRTDRAGAAAGREHDQGSRRTG